MGHHKIHVLSEVAGRVLCGGTALAKHGRGDSVTSNQLHTNASQIGCMIAGLTAL